MNDVSGARVKLRPIEADDLVGIQRWRSDPAITRYWVSRETPSLDELEQWLVDKQRAADRGFIVEDEAGRAIGFVDLFNIDRRHRRAELSLMIGERSCQGKGYGRAALREILKYAFGSEHAGGLNLHKVSLAVFAENLAARKLYESCGFRVDGVLRQDMFYDGCWHDQILMSILSYEFPESEE